MKLKCRRCRTFLMESSSLVDSHGTSFICIDSPNLNCVDGENNPVWNVNYDVAPDWIKSCFDKENWLKGKITCPKCEGRLGAFNFTQPRKCACRNSVAQPVWLMKSRIDVGVRAKLEKPKPIPLDETWTIITRPVPDKLSPECSHLVDDDLKEVGENVNYATDFELRLLNADADHPISSPKSEKPRLTSQRYEEGQHVALIRARKMRLKEGTKSIDGSVIEARQNILAKLKKRLLEEYKCPICLELCFPPSKCSPCKHMFCEACLHQARLFSNQSMICPLCRDPISSYNVSSDVKKFLEEAFPSKLLQRLKSMENIDQIDNKTINRQRDNPGEDHHFFSFFQSISISIYCYCLLCLVVFVFMFIVSLYLLLYHYI